MVSTICFIICAISAITVIGCFIAFKAIERRHITARAAKDRDKAYSPPDTISKPERVLIVIIVSGMAILLCAFFAGIMATTLERSAARTSDLATEITTTAEQIYTGQTDADLYGIPDHITQTILSNYDPSANSGVLLVTKDYSNNYTLRYLYDPSDSTVLQAVKDGWTLVTADNKQTII